MELGKRQYHVLGVEDDRTYREALSDAAKEHNVRIELVHSIDMFMDAVRLYWPPNETIVGGPDALLFDLYIGGNKDTGSLLRGLRSQLGLHRVFALYTGDKTRAERYSHERLSIGDDELRLVDISQWKERCDPEMLMKQIKFALDCRAEERKSAVSRLEFIAKW